MLLIHVQKSSLLLRLSPPDSRCAKILICHPSPARIFLGPAHSWQSINAADGRGDSSQVAGKRRFGVIGPLTILINVSIVQDGLARVGHGLSASTYALRPVGPIVAIFRRV